VIGRRGLLAGAAALGVVPAAADRFPERRLTLMVGFGAGGMSDVTARILAKKLQQLLDVTVIVENRVGAGGTLAISSVGQMEPDGYTLVTFLTDGPFTAAYQGRPINLDEWAIVGGYMPQERVLFAAKSAPFGTAREMMDYARTHPVTVSDGGAFWSGRVVEAFAKKHGLQVAVVPQRSGQAGSTEVMGGHVTMAETDRTERLRTAFRAAVEDPELRAQMVALDLTPKWIDPATYAATLREVTADGERLRDYLKA